MACWLIALDKKPDVQPISVGETVRRIIAKAILCVICEGIKTHGSVSCGPSSRRATP